MSQTSPNIIIGQNIKALREKMGINQENLAQYLTTSREQISYYEIGSRSIPSSQLSKLANLFCMDEYDFYEEDLKNRAVNIAFAFRAEQLEIEDLKSIAKFKKIVCNYLSMKNAKNDG